MISDERPNDWWRSLRLYQRTSLAQSYFTPSTTLDDGSVHVTKSNRNPKLFIERALPIFGACFGTVMPSWKICLLSERKLWSLWRLWTCWAGNSKLGVVLGRVRWVVNTGKLRQVNDLVWGTLLMGCNGIRYGWLAKCGNLAWGLARALHATNSWVVRCDGFLLFRSYWLPCLPVRPCAIDFFFLGCCGL